MNLPDTNVWLSLALSKHEFHALARDWFAAQSGARSILFCRSTQQSLLRLLTTDRLMRLYDLPPMSNAGAWGLFDGFMADPRIAMAAEPRGVEEQWRTLAARPTASPKLWMDAYLAAFAIAGEHRLITIDKAFAQFRDLNPIVLSKSS